MPVAIESPQEGPSPAFLIRSHEEGSAQGLREELGQCLWQAIKGDSKSSHKNVNADFIVCWRTQWTKMCEWKSITQIFHWMLLTAMMMTKTVTQGSFTCSISLIGTSDQRLGSCIEFKSFLGNFPRYLEVTFPQCGGCSLRVKNETHPKSHNFQQIDRGVFYFTANVLKFNLWTGPIFAWGKILKDRSRGIQWNHPWLPFTLFPPSHRPPYSFLCVSLHSLVPFQVKSH